MDDVDRRYVVVTQVKRGSCRFCSIARVASPPAKPGRGRMLSFRADVGM